MLLCRPLPRLETAHGFALHGLGPCIGCMLGTGKYRPTRTGRISGQSRSQVVPQRFHKPGNVGLVKCPRRFVFTEFANPNGQRARDVDQRTPLLSSFPPTVVRCVGPKDQKQGQHKSQKRVHHVAEIHGFVEVVQFHVAHACADHAHGEHQREQLPEHLAAVRRKNQREPTLGVVLNHENILVECTKLNPPERGQVWSVRTL